MSVIERGVKVPKLDTFVAIANALDVSADTLLIDVVTHLFLFISFCQTMSNEIYLIPSFDMI